MLAQNELGVSSEMTLEKWAWISLYKSLVANGKSSDLIFILFFFIENFKYVQNEKELYSYFPYTHYQLQLPIHAQTFSLYIPTCSPPMHQKYYSNI